MGTLTSAVISTTYKKIVFQKADNNLYYTNDSDVDVPLTTLASPLTLSGLVTASAGVKLGNDIIYNSQGTAALTLNNDEDLTITGDLTVTGNDIKGNSGATALTLSGTNVTVKGTLEVEGNSILSSAAAVMTLSNDDLTVIGDLTVTGTSSGTITLGAASDGADRSFKFGHTTLPIVMGIEDDRNIFAIHNGATLHAAANDIELDQYGDVRINKGSLECTTIDYKDGDLALTIADGGLVTVANELTLNNNLKFSGACDITFPDTDVFEIKDQTAGRLYFGCLNGKTTFTQAAQFSGTVDFEAITDATGFFANLYTVSEPETANFTAELNKTHVVTKVDGCAVVLPAPTKGARIKLIMGGLTSNTHTITTDATTTHYQGWANVSDTVAGALVTSAGFIPAAGDHIMTLNMTTTGQAAVIELIGTATNRWWVEAMIQADGTPATPFST